MNEIKSLPVRSGGKFSYNITYHDDFQALPAEITALGKSYGKLCIVSESTVAPLYLDPLRQTLERAGFTVHAFVFPAGEAEKNLSNVEDLYEFLIRNHFDRHDALIALGGGVTGDLTGFAAATYLRGIDFIQVPTTVLAMVDSSVGGKTGVDFRSFKNMVGAFHMPSIVYMNFETLKTLPARQIASGAAEVLKHGLIRDRSYFSWMGEHRAEIGALDPSAVHHMIYVSNQIKADVVEADPTEQGIRSILNFGHTIGHAVEKLMHFTLFHGECVSIGMHAALLISKQRGFITGQEYTDALQVLQSYDLPVTVHGENVPTASEILAATKSDKKMQHGRIRFILLTEIGNAAPFDDVTDEEMLAGIDAVLE